MINCNKNKINLYFSIRFDKMQQKDYENLINNELNEFFAYTEGST